jgi:hypothetical protein
MFPFPLPDETQQPGEHLTGPYDAVLLCRTMSMYREILGRSVFSPLKHAFQR